MATAHDDFASQILGTAVVKAAVVAFVAWTAPAKPGKQTPACFTQRPLLEQLLAQNNEQSSPERESMQVHSPVSPLQVPNCAPEQSLGHRFDSHATPRCFSSHSHRSILQTPNSPQSLGQMVLSLHAEPVQPS